MSQLGRAWACLPQAAENRLGIWGGLSERERRKLKKRVV